MCFSICRLSTITTVKYKTLWSLPSKTPYLLANHSPFSSHQLSATNLLHISMDLPVMNISYKWISVMYDWFLWLDYYVFKDHPCCSMNRCKWYSTKQIYHILLTFHQLMNVWVVSAFWLLWVIMPWIYSCINFCVFLFLLVNGEIFACLYFSWYMPRSKIVGPYGNCILYILQYIKVLISSYHHLSFILAILAGTKCYFIVVLIYIPLMVNDVEHPFMCF